MSDNFRCELTFPRAALDNADIRTALRDDADISEDELADLRSGGPGNAEDIGQDYDHPGLICACDVRARNGEFEATERALFKAGFAFNANAEGYLEIEPEFRYWRPGMTTPNVLQRTEGGDAYTLTAALREVIASTAAITDPDMIRGEFERLADYSDPRIEPIDAFASETTTVAA